MAGTRAKAAVCAAMRVQLLPATEEGGIRTAPRRFALIEDAIAAAGEHSRIVLAAGIYREKPLLVQNKAVTLEVEGDGVALVVCTATASAVTVGLQGVLRARNVALVSWPTSIRDDVPMDDMTEWEQFHGCVHVLPGGELTLDGCHVSGSRCHGVLVGRRAEATLTGGTTVSGVRFDSHPATPELRALFRDAGLAVPAFMLPLILHGAVVATGGRFTATKGTGFSACAWTAVYAYGTATLTDIMVSDSGACGVYVDGVAAAATVARCHITDCGDSAISVERGALAVAATTLADCGRYGLFAIDNARVAVTWCTMAGNSEAGILVALSGGLIEDCTIERSGRLSGNGIDLIATRALVLRRCTVADSKSHGVDLAKGAVAAFDQCIVTRNVLAGLRASEGADPTITGGRIDSNGKDGLVFFKDARGHVTETAIADNGGAGVRIESGGDPVLSRCRLQRNKGFGVYSVAAAGTVTDCTIVTVKGAAASAISAGFDSTLVAERNRIDGPATIASAVVMSKHAAASCRLTNNEVAVNN